MSDKKTTPPAPKTGDSLTIKYFNGTQEALRLRELSNSELEKFSKLLVSEDTPGIIALCLQRNLEWVDSLTRESYNEASQVLINQNFSATMEMALHNPIVGLRVGPLLNQMALFFELRRLRGSANTPSSAPESGSSSPSEPAPSASAARTGTESTATPPAGFAASLSIANA